MAARGPPASLSISGYPQGGGSGGSADAFRTQGRNRSGGSSGASSREPSVEGRGVDNKRGLEARGSGDFRASYHNQYQGPVFERNPRTSGQNWGYGGDRSKNRDLYWRDDSKGVHGRVQGVFYDEDGPKGSGGSSTRGYSLTIGGEGQGRRVSSSHQRQEIRYGGNARQLNGQENGNFGSQRPANSHSGYKGPAGYHRASESEDYRGRAPSVDGRGAAGASRVLSGRDLVVSKDFGPGNGRELGTFGSPGLLSRSKEAVFGGSKELETFGSPRGSLSRIKKSPRSFLSSADDVKWYGAKNSIENGRNVGGAGTVKGFKEGDLRKSFVNESSGERDGLSSSSSHGSKGGDRDTTQTPTVKQEYNEDVLTLGAYERSSSYSRSNSIERLNYLSGESAFPSPSSTTKKSLSRKNSYDMVKKHEVPDQLPVFSPSSVGKADMRRNTSVEKLSLESSTKLSQESSLSESTSKDFPLHGNEGGNALNQLPGAASESASAGMHRTRSTDWYEICLKEEEEEEMRVLARNQEEEESKLGSSQKSTPVLVRNFSARPSSSQLKRGESPVFRPRLITRENHRETKTLDKGWPQERFVREDATDSAQPNFSNAHRYADAGGKQGLFTPWNALQAVPASRNRAPSASRSRSVEVSRDCFGKPENLRVSIAGGRQEARGRRIVSANDRDEADWRADRRPSRDPSREAVVRSDLARESRAGPSGHALPKHTNERERALQDPAETEYWRAGRRLSRDHSRETVVRSDLPRESRAGPSGRSLPKQTNEREGVLQDPLVETEKRELEVSVKRANGSIRPATFYRALHAATAGDDEPLPHIVGTCPDMCPAKERSQRERLRDLALYERVSGDMRKTSKDLAVKKFCRTVVASELESTDVRPLPVLWRTQQYLLGLLDDPEFSFDIVHNFLFDRTRAIRQELGMQRILDDQTITIHEEIVRFHVLSEHELRDLNRKRSKQVDSHLNLQQLSKSLYSLLNLYISLGGKDGAHFENEAEFHAYYVLLNLGNHGQFQAEPLSLWFPNVPSHVLEGGPMQFARKALRFYRSNNFIGFFRLVREARFLQACLLELKFDSVRAMALAMLNVAEYKLHPYPLSDLAEQLILKENEVDELCMYYGLLTGVDNATQTLGLLPKQGQFSLPDNERLPQHGCPLINSKRAPSFFQEVKGSKLI